MVVSLRRSCGGHGLVQGGSQVGRGPPRLVGAPWGNLEGWPRISHKIRVRTPYTQRTLPMCFSIQRVT